MSAVVSFQVHESDGVPSGYLVSDIDLGNLARDQSILNRAARERAGDIELLDLFMVFVDISPSSDVDEERETNGDPAWPKVRVRVVIQRVCCDLPDRSIEGCNTENIPLWTDPAPQCRIPVHLALFRRLDEAERQSDDKCQAVAA